VLRGGDGTRVYLSAAVIGEARPDFLPFRAIAANAVGCELGILNQSFEQFGLTDASGPFRAGWYKQRSTTKDRSVLVLEMLLDCLRSTKPLLDVVGALEDGEAQRGKNFVDPHVRRRSRWPRTSNRRRGRMTELICLVARCRSAFACLSYRRVACLAMR
jgi:hypothetical protein